MSEFSIDAIVANCDLGFAPVNFWYRHATAWKQVISDGYQIGGIGVILEQMRYVYSVSSRFAALRQYIHEMYNDIINWFFDDHDRDYLGCIPADVRGVILHYMCRRVELTAEADKSSMVYNDSIYEIKIMLFGVTHSLCDRPSMIYVRKSETTYSWHERGRRIRGNLPQEITKCNSGEVLFHFTANGYSLCINGDRTAVRANSGPWTTDPTLMAEALELLRLHEK